MIAFQVVICEIYHDRPVAVDQKFYADEDAAAEQLSTLTKPRRKGGKLVKFAPTRIGKKVGFRLDRTFIYLKQIMIYDKLSAAR